MTDDSFSLSIDQLPGTLPMFPLEGVLLLPRGRLPLDIFEPRYLKLVDDALKEDRLIGMVQPRTADILGREIKIGRHEGGLPEIYTIGCAGRIVSFTETLDEGYEITLEGVCRFEIRDELPLDKGYRRVRVDWSSFEGDMESSTDLQLDRERLKKSVHGFFKLHGIGADWKVVSATSDENLITSLAMGCPFAPNEKQAFLEASDLAERANILISLIEMALLEDTRADLTHH